jgi:hypothetical protein
LRSRVALRRSSAVLLAGLVSLATLACTLVVDLDPLQNQDCGSDAKLCQDPDTQENICVPLGLTQFGCAVPSRCTPCSFEGVSQTRCNSGICDISSCDPGKRNCDGNIANGCEKDVDFDEQNCGDCFIACSLPHVMTQTCVDGTCRVSMGACDSGWANCDGMAGNGCECEGTCDPNTDECIETNP